MKQQESIREKVLVDHEVLRKYKHQKGKRGAKPEPNQTWCAPKKRLDILANSHNVLNKNISKNDPSHSLFLPQCRDSLRFLQSRYQDRPLWVFFRDCVLNKARRIRPNQTAKSADPKTKTIQNKKKFLNIENKHI